MAFKPIDPKRDDFRRYLERSSVLESLTKILTRIIKERPENPLEYIRHNLGDALEQADNVAYLQNELKEAQDEIKRLREVIAKMKPEALDDEKPQKQENTADVSEADLALVQKLNDRNELNDLAATMELDLKVDDSNDEGLATPGAENSTSPDTNQLTPSEVTK